ncbi:hypothetical protein J2X12_002915 [Pseudarthrobacter oxydans]|uniref:Uncharacterized protein n=1 Tax=Pseudarthrobacter oxydans TaxID=1671 RepID=A0AAW8NC51_PSEOX|nr:hypothetical protein [Pseudarthrobacter oxydans]MDR6794348.1 hypothetical protein [Pseudarthrobacter oxydans]MDR7164877.1 hypothetical protein [Pseudarthrobacter oxydans]
MSDRPKGAADIISQRDYPYYGPDLEFTQEVSDALDLADKQVGVQRLTRAEIAAIKVRAWIEGYSDSWWQERGYGLDGLQDYPAPDFLAEELVEWNRYSLEDA